MEMPNIDPCSSGTALRDALRLTIEAHASCMLSVSREWNTWAQRTMFHTDKRMQDLLHSCRCMYCFAGEAHTGPHYLISYLAWAASHKYYRLLDNVLPATLAQTMALEHRPSNRHLSIEHTFWQLLSYTLLYHVRKGHALPTEYIFTWIHFYLAHFIAACGSATLVHGWLVHWCILSLARQLFSHPNWSGTEFQNLDIAQLFHILQCCIPASFLDKGERNQDWYLYKLITNQDFTKDDFESYCQRKDFCSAPYCLLSIAILIGRVQLLKPILTWLRTTAFLLLDDCPPSFLNEMSKLIAYGPCDRMTAEALHAAMHEVFPTASLTVSIPAIQARRENTISGDIMSDI
jgi:hypothetical protein